jgi:DNA polymerase III psi subunit
MDSQLTADRTALHLFFTDDVYLVDDVGSQGVEFGVKADKPGLSSTENVTSSAESIVKSAAIVAETPVDIIVPQSIEFKYLGKNLRNILILVNDEQNDVSDENGRELLRKIVKSINLSANDFALLNYAKYKGVGFKQLQSHFSSTLIFSFGVTPADLSMSKAHPEHVIVMEGPVKMIFSAELRILDKNPAGKKALWGSLQNLGL